MSVNDPWQIWLENTARSALRPDPLAVGALDKVAGNALKVLVLGAGTGADLPVFLTSPRVRAVKAVDASKTAERLCRAVVAGITGATSTFSFVRKSITNLSPSEIGKPDLVIANGIMPYLLPRAQEATMKAILREMATGGAFVGNFAARDGSLPTANFVRVHGVADTEIKKWAKGTGCEAVIKPVDQYGEAVRPNQTVYGWHVCITKPAQKADGLQTVR